MDNRGCVVVVVVVVLRGQCPIFPMVQRRCWDESLKESESFEPLYFADTSTLPDSISKVISNRGEALYTCQESTPTSFAPSRVCLDVLITRV